MQLTFDFDGSRLDKAVVNETLEMIHLHNDPESYLQDVYDDAERHRNKCVWINHLIGLLRTKNHLYHNNNAYIDFGGKFWKKQEEIKNGTN